MVFDAIRDAYEDDSQYTVSLGLYETQARSFHTSSDIDWVRLSLTDGTWYTVETYSAGTRDVDTVMFLYDENTAGPPPTYLSELDAWYDDDDGGDGYYSRISFQAFYTGYHWVSIREYGGATGYYQLTLY